ncbi:MAG TPA: hypothetical protein PLM27_01840 [Chitinophagales bacterium]|nr:hypothetical protein [Chitinophagales bacterium]HNE44886.1 hypothetical protein [Chitinophagales bacterium]
MSESELPEHKTGGFKILEIVPEIIAAFQIIISPLLIGSIIGAVIYLTEPSPTRLLIGILIGILGLVIGIIWAVRQARHKGAAWFMSRTIASPELDEKPYDFKISYRFLSAEEGGRKTGPPFQGYRPDFVFAVDANENVKSPVAWMIHPIFADADGQVIENKTTAVAEEGIAYMRVIFREHKHLYIDKIKVGEKGYMIEGPYKVALCSIIEVY